MIRTLSILLSLLLPVLSPAQREPADARTDAETILDCYRGLVEVTRWRLSGADQQDFYRSLLSPDGTVLALPPHLAGGLPEHVLLHFVTKEGFRIGESSSEWPKPQARMTQDSVLVRAGGFLLEFIPRGLTKFPLDWRKEPPTASRFARKPIILKEVPLQEFPAETVEGLRSAAIYLLEMTPRIVDPRWHDHITNLPNRAVRPSFDEMKDAVYTCGYARETAISGKSLEVLRLLARAQEQSPAP